MAAGTGAAAAGAGAAAGPGASVEGRAGAVLAEGPSERRAGGAAEPELPATLVDVMPGAGWGCSRAGRAVAAVTPGRATARFAAGDRAMAT
jgi:hypothetical protein